MTKEIVPLDQRALLARARRFVQSTGVVLGRFHSAINGAPCVAIATFKGNVKTGPMVQIWIVPADGDVRSVAKGGNGPMVGQDGVCPGTCAKRPDIVRKLRATGVRADGCYVTPMSVYSIRSKYARGGYPDMSPQLLFAWANMHGLGVRLAAWGDPCAIPPGHPILMAFRMVRRRTGYTHGWRNRPDLMGLVMASTDTTRDVARAQAEGWGQFYAGRKEVGGKVCLTERDDAATCATCFACDGRPALITIPPHGFDTDRKARLRVL
jgi:hypothetical protein